MIVALSETYSEISLDSRRKPAAEKKISVKGARHRTTPNDSAEASRSPSSSANLRTTSRTRPIKKGQMLGGRRASGAERRFLLKLRLDRLQLADQLLVRRPLDHRVELRAVVVDEADALDEDVIDDPAPRRPALHPVIDVQVTALLGDEARANRRVAALHAVAEIRDTPAL